MQSKFLVAFLCCHVALLDCPVGVKAFVVGLSQISSFLGEWNSSIAIGRDHVIA